MKEESPLMIIAKKSRVYHFKKARYKICERCQKPFLPNNWAQKRCGRRTEKNSCNYLFKAEYIKRYGSKYRIKNKNKVSEWHRAFYAKNRNEIRKKHSKWYREKYKTDQVFREKVLARGRKRTKENPEYCRKKGKEWRRKNPNYSKDYYRKKKTLTPKE